MNDKIKKKFKIRIILKNPRFTIVKITIISQIGI